ncbi:MAG: hypothetical protein NTV11_10215 [Rhodocyclales bacterium]|nr:hypothetical protein [Rhodocyclales bacterium]
MTDSEDATTTTCRSCCYWSELIAKTRGGVLVAMCLAERGPRSWRYTRDDSSCTAWERAREGSIDDPETERLARTLVLESSDPKISIYKNSETQVFGP